MTASAISNSNRLLSTASSKATRNSDILLRNTKTGWSERVGMPISTYNEKVHNRYKLMFEHLWEEKSTIIN